MFRPVSIFFLLSIIGPFFAVAEGERLEESVFKLKWSFVSVGTVTMTLERIGPEVRRGTLEAKANAFMRKVYDFHTIISSRFPKEAKRSLGYSRVEHTTGDRHETFFDWEAMTVRYSKNGDMRVPLPLKGDTHDPLSIVYAFRSVDFPLESGVVRLPVSDGKAITEARFEISEPETVKTPAGKFEARKVTADFGDVRAIFARPEGALIHVWLTDDERRFPVKLESEATMGSFTAVLEEQPKE